MTARRIDGKVAAQAIRDKIAALVPEFARRTGRAPGLATVLVGEIRQAPSMSAPRTAPRPKSA
jgi:5,10-methylene-tetrahydrofolate dehydrogenase/Methenyl tetrahydrofolate cyclohydrolase